MQWFTVDLKTLLDLAMPITNAVMLSEGKFQIFGQETPNLIDPYIVLLYYMIQVKFNVMLECIQDLSQVHLDRILDASKLHPEFVRGVVQRN